MPLPTIRAHIEGRGFDHIGLLARTMAREKHLGVAKIIKRVNASVQVGAAMVERKQQAREAYALCGEIDSGAQYLLLDDVLTTGSSIRAAAEVLRAAGAKQIGVAVIAKS